MSTAVITGAASGLGRCFALACSGRKYNLILADRDEQKLTELSRVIAVQDGVEVRSIAGDLQQRESRDQLIAAAVAAADLSLWINNAGVSAKGPARDMDPALATSVAQLNVTALTDLATRAIPLLLSGGGGRMINVSSLGAWYPIPYMAAYAASKSYILHFSMALDEELAGSGVRVSALCPGGMKTNELTIRDLEGQGILGRLTVHSPESVAELALRASQRGQKIIIPGLWNRFLRSFGSGLPKAVLARSLERRWRRSLTAAGLMHPETRRSCNGDTASPGSRESDFRAR